MSIIEDFIDQYQNKISYYEKVRAYAENLVGNTLRDSGMHGNNLIRELKMQPIERKLTFKAKRY